MSESYTIQLTELKTIHHIIVLSFLIIIDK